MIVLVHEDRIAPRGASARCAPRRATAGDTPRLRILVADDEASICDVIRLVLATPELDDHGVELHPGFEVLCVGDGADALEVVANGWAPDLIIMDLMMPRVAGIIAIRKIKTNDNPAIAAIPIIAMSAGHNLKRTQIPEADALLPKPFDIDGLLAQARFWAGRHRQGVDDSVMP